MVGDFPPNNKKSPLPDGNKWLRDQNSFAKLSQPQPTNINTCHFSSSSFNATLIETLITIRPENVHSTVLQNDEAHCCWHNSEWNIMPVVDLCFLVQIDTDQQIQDEDARQKSNFLICTYYCWLSQGADTILKIILILCWPVVCLWKMSSQAKISDLALCNTQRLIKMSPSFFSRKTVVAAKLYKLAVIHIKIQR